VAGSLRLDPIGTVLYGITAGVVSVSASGTDPLSVVVSNPFNTTNVVCTGNMLARYQNAPSSHQFIVEIGTITTTQITFMISRAEANGWGTTEAKLH